MEVPFMKMHGAGNDFIIIRYEDFPYERMYSHLASESCHRHFGIGADGILIVAQSRVADLKMFYYNSDGSLANMCGNGIRCFAKFAYDEGLVQNEEFTVETLAGIKTVLIKEKNGRVYSVTVNMGKMNLNPQDIPVKSKDDYFIKQQMMVEDKVFEVSSVLMGVPHTVIFTDDLSLENIMKYGPIIENHENFPMKTNVNFAKIMDRNNIQVRTWERGAGYTLACGTGVASVCGLAQYLNYVDRDISVDIDGGRIQVSILENNDIYMEGPAKKICRGVYYLK